MIRRVLPLLSLASALLAGCQTMTTKPDVTAVEAVERARFQAFVAGDAAAMRPLLADDLLYCHSSGVCQNREEMVGAITSKSTVYRKMDLLAIRPRVLGPDAVMINGKVDAVVVEGGTKVIPFQAIYTDVYVKRDGRWQLVSWQSTRLP
jgi:uncharacterized protein (TIGR02246 family)